MKFGQILVCCMTNIFSMFLAECWSLETSSRLFYDFIKMTLQQDLANFLWLTYAIFICPLFNFSTTTKNFGILPYLVIE